MDKPFSTHLRHAAYAWGGGYLALLTQFYPIFNVQTRFNLYWNHSYYAAILTGILILALFYFAAYKILFRLCPASLRRYFIYAVSVVLWAIAVRCVVSVAARAGYLEAGWPAWLNDRSVKFAYYFGVPLILLSVFRDRFVRALQAGYLAVSLVAMIMLVNAAFYDTREPSNILPPLEYAPADEYEPLPNVYIFIFDEWSYQRTYAEGKPEPFMTNLMALSRSATVYHNAYTPGSATIVTMPKFMFQRDRDLLNKPYSEVERLAYSGLLPRENSIFAEHTNHFRAAFGFQIDYPRLVGADCDYTGTIPVLVVGMSYRAWLKDLLMSQVLFLAHFGIGIERPEVLGQEGGAHRFNTIYDRSREIMRRVEQPTFAIFHLSLPHGPFIWDRDGVVQGKTDIRSSTVKNYQGNLRYLDRVIGEVVALLREQDKFDNSLLIITSDHSWRADPAYLGEHGVSAYRHDQWIRSQDENPRSFLKQVPLIVRQPGQTTGEEIGDPITLTELYDKYIRPLPK